MVHLVISPAPQEWLFVDTVGERCTQCHTKHENRVAPNPDYKSFLLSNDKNISKVCIIKPRMYDFGGRFLHASKTSQPWDGATCLINHVTCSTDL